MSILKFSLGTAALNAQMARPREFDEQFVLKAVMQCFWNRGYEATSVKDLVDKTGIIAASLYNAFGDKRALFRAALDHYIESSVGERIRHCETLALREGIGAFFRDILNRSLTDRDHKGCLLVNSALEIAPHDADWVRAYWRGSGQKRHCSRASSDRHLLSLIVNDGETIARVAPRLGVLVRLFTRRRS